ncbi:hypothetical protein GCM10010435_30330 [Winogradskya consettensis]|uniref:Uncharacterized protein n=1 Tax=Winogradskya consettensis TaxID=113560 RepID=A0A919VV67_9ACTN|nr:LuxR family transcriptional regulator [Actinoplanes consettensis]GIM70603.1 hypothetical protein Aco04nite_21170 [Actinoplanes consettensis]
MTRQPDAPRHVVTSTADADTVVRRLSRDGWSVQEGFALTDAAFDVSTERLVLHGRISDPDTLQLAVLAAARGAGVVAVCDTDSPMGRALVDDLSRLGTVQLGAGPGTPAPAAADDNGTGVVPLVPEQQALLDRLAAGDTIAAAAAAEFLSLRTANRRIAEARALFGVRTTREAVLAYLRQRGTGG